MYMYMYSTCHSYGMLHAVCYMYMLLGTDLSWLRLMEDFGLFLFLSELALSCMEAEGREVEGGGWRGEGGEGREVEGGGWRGEGGGREGRWRGEGGEGRGGEGGGEREGRWRGG